METRFREVGKELLESLQDDVRTPLTAMVAWLRAMRGRVGSGDQVRALETSAVRALVVLDGVLTGDGGDRPSGSGAADRDFLATVRAVIDQHLATPDFRVGELAGQLGLSRSLLYRRLGAVGGPPPAQMILDRRLDKAAELLRSSSMAVGEIADAVGFRAPAHFSECFRRRFAVSPTAYRRTGSSIRDESEGLVDDLDTG